MARISEFGMSSLDPCQSRAGAPVDLTTNFIYWGLSVKKVAPMPFSHSGTLPQVSFFRVHLFHQTREQAIEGRAKRLLCLSFPHPTSSN